MRTFSIICVNDQAKFDELIVEKLPVGSKILVFQRKQLDNEETASKLAKMRQNHDVEMRFYPDEYKNHQTKVRNFASKTFFDEKIEGFVHVIEDRIDIFGEPSKFLDEIERMMTMPELKSWFNTSCDGCNYVYSRYNPRLFISVDEEEAKKRYEKIVAWCSNANTGWICYNMNLATFEDIRFDENLTFPMYYIIEFLARRRNTKKPGQLDYMNYYPSIPEELGVFRYDDSVKDYKFSDEEIKENGQIFNQMKVDNHPDQNLDVLMEDMRNAILRH